MGDRGAAAGRERVAVRLRRRRGEDPLRPERGQERRRLARRARSSRAREEGGAVQRRSGTSPSASTRRRRTSARSSRWSSAARSTRPAAPRRGMLEALEHALSHGQRAQTDRLRGQSSLFGEARRSCETPADRGRGVREERAAAAGEGSARPLRLGASAAGDRDAAAAQDGLRRSPSVERRRDGEIVTVGGIVCALKQLTTKKGEPMVFMRLDDVTAAPRWSSSTRSTRPRASCCVTDRILVVKGADRPQGGRDEAARDGGRRLRGDAGAQRGAAQDRRAPGAGRAHPRAGHGS